MDEIQPFLGRVLKDTYRIDRFLGEGGPSVVYQGTDLLLDVPVAIKRLKSSPTLSDGESFSERFLREGRTQARLVHQHLVGVRAVLEEEGHFYIVMEFVEGSDLLHIAEAIGDKPFPLPLLGMIFVQILSGLEYAHSHEVIHRDIKPSNILVTPEGRAKLADFGIAKAVSDSRITQTGYLVGTVAYMSPEQLKGATLDPRVDMYSLGIALYELIAGQHPFRTSGAEGSNYELMSKHIYEQPRPLASLRDGLPVGIADVVHRAIEKEPDARFADCQAFADALTAAFQEAGIPIPTASQDVILFPWAVKGHVAGDTLEQERGTDDASGTGAFVREVDVASAAHNGPEETGAYERSEVADPSEERPSGVLVAVPVQQGRQTADFPPRSERPPVTPPVRSPEHELANSASSGPDTGSFFREDEPATGQGTGVFDREAALTPAPSSGGGQGTGVFDREAASSSVGHKTLPGAPPTIIDTNIALPVSEPGTTQETASLSEASGARRGLVLFGLLLAGVLVGGVVMWQAIRMTGTPNTPKQRADKRGILAHTGGDAGERSSGGQDDVRHPPMPRQHHHLTPRVPAGGQAAPPLVGAAVCPGAPGSMLLVQGGMYWQGEVRTGRRKSDRKMRQVDVSSFCLDRKEVTFSAYQMCVERKQCSRLRGRGRPQEPVRFVSWGQAAIYCQSLGKRLPTEAEWEYALRRESRDPYPWGKRLLSTSRLCERAIWGGCRKRRPLPFSPDRRVIRGIHDLLGNVWEWVQDCYDRHGYRKLGRSAKAFQVPGCPRRVVRGGSYRSGRKSLQVFFRGTFAAVRYRQDIGFRCASAPSSQKGKREL